MLNFRTPARRENVTAQIGIERSTFLIGPDGKLVREWRGVKVPGHAEEVLEAVRAI